VARRSPGLGWPPVLFAAGRPYPAGTAGHPLAGRRAGVVSVQPFPPPLDTGSRFCHHREHSDPARRSALAGILHAVRPDRFPKTRQVRRCTPCAAQSFVSLLSLSFVLSFASAGVADSTVTSSSGSLSLHALQEALPADGQSSTGIVVQVLDPQGRPLAHAEVKLWRPPSATCYPPR